MKKTERANFIMEKLEKLYPETPVPLNHSNLYELLIAVLLSAQCTDERVNKITPQLFKKANSPKKMCKLNIDESPETPTKFNVRGIPTLLLFKNGAVVSQKVGAAAKSQLSAWIDSNT